MSTFRELQSECVRLKLKPCRGAGITRAVLERKIREATIESRGIGQEDVEHEELQDTFYEDPEEIGYEEAVRRQDPNLYDALKPYIHLLPDLRPEETASKMMLEEQDPWRIIYEEIMALGREGPEADEERELMEAINSCKRWRLDDFLSNRQLMKRFLNIYSAISRLLVEIEPEMILPVFVAAGLPEEYGGISIIKEITPDIISAIRDKETMFKIKDRNEGRIYDDDEQIDDDDEQIDDEDEGEDAEVYDDEEQRNIALIEAIDKENVGAVYYHLIGDERDNLHELLMISAQFGNVEILNILLDFPNIPSLLSYDESVEIIEEAAKHGQTEAVSFLVDRFAEIYREEEVEVVVKKSLRATTQPRKVKLNPKTKYYQVIKNIAFENGYSDLILYLANQGVKLDQTPLSVVIPEGRTNIVELLLQRQIGTYNVADSLWPELAARYSRFDILSLLLNDQRVRSVLSEEEIHKYERMLEKYQQQNR